MSGGGRLHSALGAIGVLSWLLYLLGCGWSAWSPDGSKVLVLRSGAGEVSALAVNVRSGSTKLLATFSSADPTFPVGQWDRSGKRIILLRAMPGTLSVLVAPVGASAPIRDFRLKRKSQDRDLLLPPYPQIGGDLFIADERLHRLNLETGAAMSKDLPEGTDMVMLFQRGERVGYVTAREDAELLVVGEVDRTDLSLRAAFEVRIDELRPDGATPLEIGPSVAVAPSGERIAMPATSKDGRDEIVVLASNGVERAFTPALPEGHRLGNLQWSRDGRTLYAAVLGPTAQKGVVEYSAGVIPLGKQAPRLIPITRLRVVSPEDDLPDSWVLSLQVSLSPDGRALATNTGFLVEDQRLEPLDGAAVYIVNLARGTVRRFDLPKSRGGSVGEKDGAE